MLLPLAVGDASPGEFADDSLKGTEESFAHGFPSKNFEPAAMDGDIGINVNTGETAERLGIAVNDVGELYDQSCNSRAFLAGVCGGDCDLADDGIDGDNEP